MTDDTESDSPFSSLTPLQAQVATALAHGTSITAAALASGLHRVTIHRWLKNNTAFYTAVDQGTTEYALALRDDLRELSERALQTLSRVLDDPTASPSVLVKTAMFILQRPQFPKPGWSLPVSCLEPGACEWPADSPLLAEDEQRLRDLEAAENSKTGESAAPEPPAGDATPCNEVQQVSRILTPVAASDCGDGSAAPLPEPPAGPAPCNEMQHVSEILTTVAAPAGDHDPAAAAAQPQCNTMQHISRISHPPAAPNGHARSLPAQSPEAGRQPPEDPEELHTRRNASRDLPGSTLEKTLGPPGAKDAL